MKRTIIAAVAIAGIVGTVALPTFVAGNARRTNTNGSLAEMSAAETPYIAELDGANETPDPGDPDGMGAATVSFADTGLLNQQQICWDMAYSNINPPTAAHIHSGAAGVAGPPVFTFPSPTPGVYTGCGNISTTTADQIQANPSQYYVNVHTADFPGGAIRGQLTKGPAPAGATHFLPTPLRAYDSRIAPATKFAAGETRTISLGSGVDSSGASSIAVPPGATAAIVTLTATGTDGPGYITAYSNAAVEPATSNLNFTAPGATVAVSTQVAVDSAGQIKITVGPAGTDVIIDVAGYLY